MDEDTIRVAELDQIRGRVEECQRVLEVGAGSGLQASLIAAWGPAVAAVDLPDRQRVARHHTVIEYDGTRLPFPDAAFDCVYSSNTLEHVVDLPGLLAEMRRVLRGGGLSLNYVPTPTWRLWSSLTYPVAMWRRRVLSPRYAVGPILGPHGEFPSALHEVWAFSERAWRRRFMRAGFSARSEPSRFFYTGNNTMPRLSLDMRARFAPLLGPPSRLYELRANDRTR